MVGWLVAWLEPPTKHTKHKADIITETPESAAHGAISVSLLKGAITKQHFAMTHFCSSLDGKWAQTIIQKLRGSGIEWMPHVIKSRKPQTFMLDA